MISAEKVRCNCINKYVLAEILLKKFLHPMVLIAESQVFNHLKIIYSDGKAEKQLKLGASKKLRLEISQESIAASPAELGYEV